MQLARHVVGVFARQHQAQRIGFALQVLPAQHASEHFLLGLHARFGVLRGFAPRAEFGAGVTRLPVQFAQFTVSFRNCLFRFSQGVGGFTFGFFGGGEFFLQRGDATAQFLKFILRLGCRGGSSAGDGRRQRQHQHKE